ncbi:phage baseplate protein [Portibacter lacus]|uniref:Baseplate structural protein Gp10 C-terminal domain-containing protein n=1 Tax=Portibacter lacus TaxID=1099794 RepID=A0AA37SML0_9BACT|nr:hypothetical protein [Portibacter lacus]GLR15576.1 hypothetical protein GCM10007940_01910 [Portibacter lacus]
MKIVKKIKIALTALSIVVLAGSALHAQKVGINTQTVPADAVLNIESGGSKGMIPPKVSNGNRPSSATVGNTIYNTTDDAYQVYTDLGWETIGTPKGGIIMWRGTTAPTGWAICDGNNGTPDLRGRFIVGTGNSGIGGTTTYALNATGGEQTVTLTTSQLPAHTHGSGTLTTDDSGSHSHGLGSRGVVLSCVGCNSGNVADGSTDDSDISGTKQGGNHSHDVTGNTGSAGTGNAHENRPPYYALAYIMKL